MGADKIIGTAVSAISKIDNIAIASISKIAGQEVSSFTNTYSMNFDGVDDYISLGVPTYLESKTTVTVSLWVQFTDVTTASYTSVFTLGSADPRELYVRLNPEGVNRRIEFGVSNSFTRATSSDFSDLVSGTWYHILGCYNKDLDDGTDAQIYLDGTMISEINTNATLPASITDDINLGDNGLWAALEGNIDEVSVWNTDQRANASAIYNSGTPPDLTSLSPVGWWRMGENGSFKSTQWLLPTEANKDNVSNYSMTFDGVDDWINCGTDSSTDLTTQMTISTWVKMGTTDTTTTIGPILFKDSTGGVARSYSMGWRPLSAGYDKMYVAVFHTNGNATSLYTSTAGALSDGNWHHVMGTYDGTDGTDALKIYVDGVLDNTATPTSGDTGIRVSATTNLALASLSHGASWWYGGSLDEVALFSTDQSANISTIFNGGKPADLTSFSPVAWYRMGEDASFSTNWTVPDSSPNSNTGTSANMTIEDRIGDAPNSTSNAISLNMVEADREADVP